MIAIFTDQEEAQKFADQVQAYLTVNRPDYSADKWADVQKHPTIDLWAVPMPPEPMDAPVGATTMETLTDDWRP